MAASSVCRERKWQESQTKWKKNASSKRTQSTTAKKKLQGGCHDSHSMLKSMVDQRKERTKIDRNWKILIRLKKMRKVNYNKSII